MNWGQICEIEIQIIISQRLKSGSSICEGDATVRCIKN